METTCYANIFGYVGGVCEFDFTVERASSLEVDPPDVSGADSARVELFATTDPNLTSV